MGRNPRLTPKDETRSRLTIPLHITAEQSACLVIGEQIAESGGSSALMLKSRSCRCQERAKIIIPFSVLIRTVTGQRFGIEQQDARRVRRYAAFRGRGGPCGADRCSIAEDGNAPPVTLANSCRRRVPTPSGIAFIRRASGRRSRPVSYPVNYDSQFAWCTRRLISPGNAGRVRRLHSGRRPDAAFSCRTSCKVTTSGGCVKNIEMQGLREVVRVSWKGRHGWKRDDCWLPDSIRYRLHDAL